MLYISILLEDSINNCRVGYADDIAIVRVGKNPSEVVEDAQVEEDRIVQLALTHRIRFDLSKSCLYFKYHSDGTSRNGVVRHSDCPTSYAA